MDINSWYMFRELLPSMKKEDLFVKYAESAGSRDKNYLWEKIKEIHNLDDPEKPSDAREFAKNACAKFVKLAVENPALYDFVLDTDCDEYWNIVDPEGKVKNRSRLASEFFIPWVAVCVPRSIALEVVYGYGIDIYGNYREIPQDDPFYYFVYKNELFAAIAERGIATVGFLGEIHPKKIGFLAAGMAPEFRHLGLRLSKDQEAILADNDPTINSADLLKNLPEKDQITYLEGESGNLINILSSDVLKGSDAIIANGIICYVWDRFPQILGAAKRLLNPGGTFIFELYPKHWEWARNRDIKGFYLPLKLFESNKDAENSVKSVAKSLGIEDISTLYYFDDFNNEIMVLFKVTMPE
ncbi:class I SAM-dependent methyltransferase [Candidatus Saccharibacteria bacterium]|nr:class I SAM-dependent methyltransferase [Candidatus Saccharibacteria bacterium]